MLPLIRKEGRHEESQWFRAEFRLTREGCEFWFYACPTTDLDLRERVIQALVRNCNTTAMISAPTLDSVEKTGIADIPKGRFPVRNSGHRPIQGCRGKDLGFKYGYKKVYPQWATVYRKTVCKWDADDEVEGDNRLMERVSKCLEDFKGRAATALEAIRPILDEWRCRKASVVEASE